MPVLTRRSVLLALAVVALLLTVATVAVLGRRRDVGLSARLDLIEERVQADAMAHTAAENDLRERLTVLETRKPATPTHVSAPPAHVSAPPTEKPRIGKRIARGVVRRFRKGKDQ
jgi:hypothetical protein